MVALMVAAQAPGDVRAVVVGDSPLTRRTDSSAHRDHARARTAAWRDLAALHGVNDNAKEVTIRRSPDGNIKVTAKYREAELPSPGPAIGEKIMSAVREITHIEGAKGKSPLALGIRNDSIELKIKMKSKDEGEKVTLKFPE